jgi:hypothetical protein
VTWITIASTVFISEILTAQITCVAVAKTVSEMCEDYDQITADNDCGECNATVGVACEPQCSTWQYLDIMETA